MPPLTYSACVEWLFADETDDVCERIRLAKSGGLAAVEFWRWRKKDLEAIRRTLAETGLPLTAMLLEPVVAITEPSKHALFLEALGQSVEAARRLDARGLMVQVGDARPGVARDAQHQSVIAGLKAGAEIVEGTGVTLLVEPLNTKIDHPGYFLDNTREGLDVIEAVASPDVRLLYDIYHSVVMGEIPARVLENRVHLIGHVHLADAPGRHEPGSGAMDWQLHLQWLRAHGYGGAIGLEYKPERGTRASLDFIREFEVGGGTG